MYDRDYKKEFIQVVFDVKINDEPRYQISIPFPIIEEDFDDMLPKLASWIRNENLKYLKRYNNPKLPRNCEVK